MFETCKYPGNTHKPVHKDRTRKVQFLYQLQNIFPGLWFASKCISKCTTTIFYCFRDHFPYYGGVVVSSSNAHEVMNHYIYARSNIEATAVASRQAETHHAMCKQLCQNDRTTHHGCIYQISVNSWK